MQGIVDSVRLCRVCAPVGIDIHIFCNRHIQRRIRCFVPGTHIKPSAEGILKPPGRKRRIIHTSQHTAVCCFPCFNYTAFIARRFKGNHIVIGAKEANRMIYGCPLSVQTDIFCRHGIAFFIFTAGKAAGRFIPTAEGIGILFQSSRIIGNNSNGVRIK